MKNKIAALVAASLFTTHALAAVTLDLSGDYVRIGVSDYGTIGSKSNTSPGILYDNSGTGTFNTSYDYLTPGSPFEGFGITLTTGGATTNYHNNNTGIQNISGGVLTDYSGTAYNGTTFDNRAVWTGSTTNFDLAHDYRFNNNQKFVDITTVLTAKADLTNLYFGRFTDPDARAAAGDSSATLNALGYGVIPSNQVVFSEATISKYALGLYSADTNVGAGISSSWSPLGATYYNGANGGNGDYTIGLGWYLASLANGATATFSYAYIFGPSAFAAGETAVTSGAGGGTPGVVPGCTSSCTLTNVGDASAPATPTLVSTVTNYAVASVAVATPTVTYSQTNTPMQDGIRLKLTRIDTTTTSTLTTTTTTTTPTVVSTYSDSSTTSTVGTPVVSSSSATTVAATDMTTTGSASLAAPASVVAYGLLADMMNMPDPLNRVSISGASIEKKSGVSVDIGKDTWMYITPKGNRGSQTSGAGIELGVERRLDYDRLVGIQIGYNNNTLKKEDNAGGNWNTAYASVYGLKKLGDWTVKPAVGISSSRFDTNRTIEEFGYANKFKTDGRSYWADLQVLAPSIKDLVTPYAGVTLRRYTVDGGTESGSAETAVTWNRTSKTQVNPYIGARLDSRPEPKGMFYSLDGRVTRLSKFQFDGSIDSTYIGVNPAVGQILMSVDGRVGYKFNDRGHVWVGATSQRAGDYNNTIIGIGAKIDF